MMRVEWGYDGCVTCEMRSTIRMLLTLEFIFFNNAATGNDEEIEGTKVGRRSFLAIQEHFGMEGFFRIIINLVT